MSTTNITLTHSCCIEGMKKMPSGQTDLIVTSPPYNLGIDYNTYQDTHERSAFISWCLEWALEVKRVMSNDASFFLNVGAAPSNPLLPHQLLLALTEDKDTPHFTLQNTFHWIKSISVKNRTGETTSVGHFKPINSQRYVNDCHEYIFHLTKTGNVQLDRKGAGVPYVHKSNITRWGHTEGADKRCRGNTWFIPYDTIKSRAKDRPHPATFPIGLTEQCIRIHGQSREIHLLDPFNGIGTSAVAALRMGISSYTGFDIDADYLSITRERLAAEEAQDQRP